MNTGALNIAKVQHFFLRTCFANKNVIIQPESEKNKLKSKYKKGPRTNNQIRVSTIDLIDQDGEYHKSIATSIALQKAKDIELTLVEINPQSNPPLCKIMDYGKYKYEESKKASLQRKKKKENVIKEFQVKPNIGENDLEVKIKKARDALEDGNSIKIVLSFSGREMIHQNIGMKIMDTFIEKVSDLSKIFSKPKLEGRRSIAILSSTFNKNSKESDNSAD